VVAPKAVAHCCDSQPLRLSADYRILETRRLADGLVLGYLSVDFSFTDRPPLQVYLSVLVKQSTEGDLISHYQVSSLN
jgi:hypothetical protein